jgi:putative peptide zinc metalloprotease protein
MAVTQSGTIYSDAWYKLANARVSLLAGVRVTSQVYRGQRWFALEDPYSHRFFRVTPQAYAFLQTLDQTVTVDEAWRQFLAQYPDDAPGQEEVVQLLSQLHVSNLLFFRDAANSIQIDKRAREVRGKELRAKALSFLYFRVPLWDPDRFLTRMDPWFRVLPGWFYGVLWAAAMFFAAWALLGRLDDLADHSQGIFAWANLPLLYVSLAVMKVLHEFAHGVVCKRYGGSVHTFGVMFLVTTPLPYVDTSASWSFPNKWHRVLVGSAGMLADLFMAALGAMVWAQTGPGLVNSLAFNVMLIGSVSSLLFNGNPLLRFDAYYVLADILDIPNLYNKAQRYWYYLADRYLLGSHAAQSPVDIDSERKWLLTYAPVSLAYRLVVSYAIILFVMDLWQGLGLVVLLITSFMLIVQPTWKGLKHLTGAKVQAHRWRAWSGAGGAVALVVVLVGFVPWPHSMVAPGVLQYSKLAVLFAPMDAKLTQATWGLGQGVQRGDALMRFDDTLVRLELERARLELAELDAMQRQAMADRPFDVQALAEQMATKRGLIGELQARMDDLVVRAPASGRYVAVRGWEQQGMWLKQGTEVAHVLGEGGEYQFAAVVSQERAREIFASQLGQVSLRLVGQSDVTLSVQRLMVVPYQQQRLPSAALGWMGGGDVAVATDDSQGDKAAEDFFELRAVIAPPEAGAVTMLHGLKGAIQIELPAQTLWRRMVESLRQLVQKRYGMEA